MSQKPNPRRGEERHQDNGPTWEGDPPNSGCNSTHVARSRKKWKRYAARSERRVGNAVKFMSMGSSGRHPRPRPEE
jgi:hypothetical protein